MRPLRLAAIGGGLLIFVMLALLVGRGLRRQGAEVSAQPGDRAAGAPGPGGSVRAGAPVRAAAGAVASAPSAPAAVARPAADSPGLERARQLIAARQIDPALALLNQLRAAEPDNADVLYLQAMVYFDNRRFTEGLAAAQLAVRKDPSLKDGSGPHQGGDPVARERSRLRALAGLSPGAGTAGDAVHPGSGAA